MSTVVAPGTIGEALSRVVSALPGGGEARSGQLAMAEAVGHSISARRHLVVQAGTGTGKSLAYLVPAILSRRKVVIATATLALQDQLAHKDLPALSSFGCRWSVLKGRANYLCRQKAAEVAGDGGAARLDFGAPGSGAPGQVRRLVAWGRRTSSGDRADLEFEPTPQAWSAVSAGSNECPGPLRCPSGEQCLAEAARRRATDADIVVVNTQLYAAHLASGGTVLPEHEIVVFDEAHALEDIMTEGLGKEITPARLRALARMVAAQSGGAAAAAVDELSAAGDALQSALSPLVGSRLPGDLGKDLTGAVVLGRQRLSRVTSLLREAPGGGADEPASKARALLATTHLAEEMTTALDLGAERVAWVEGSQQAPALKVAPIDVAPILAPLLWNRVTAVLTSATIPPGLGPRLGMGAGCFDELDVGSPFPFSTHGLLYCATHLPDRRDPDAEAAVHDEIYHLIRAAGGKTLALFTSWRAMERAAEAVRVRVPFRILRQSDLPKPALIEAFTDEESSCLFATMGFWQGIDVPGPALSLVVIDRLPFPRPDEPLTQARRERAGPGAFRLVDLPRAAAMLAQGAGRLIRSTTDRGVVAVLDPRLSRASYRWELVRALPPMARTRDRSEVEAFLSRRGAPEPVTGPP